jgi:hypothetical protein
VGREIGGRGARIWRGGNGSKLRRNADIIFPNQAELYSLEEIDNKAVLLMRGAETFSMTDWGIEVDV